MDLLVDLESKERKPASQDMVLNLELAQVLPVYVNQEKDKYYITCFAASHFNLITGEQAGELRENGNMLYEISAQILEELKKLDSIEIQYVFIRNDYNRNLDLGLELPNNDINDVIDINYYFGSIKNEENSIPINNEYNKVDIDKSLKEKLFNVEQYQTEDDYNRIVGYLEQQEYLRDHIIKK